MPPVRWSTDQLKATKALYCRPLRLQLAVWILDNEGEPFFLQEAQDAMRSHGEAPSGTRAEVNRFRDFGMLLEFRESTRVYFQIVHASPYWAGFLALAAAVKGVENDSEALRSHGSQQALPATWTPPSHDSAIDTSYS
jgi:hypothetical protein